MIKAKKKFGQNFLTSSNIKAQIIQAIPDDAKNIIEIGAGLGDLTKELLKLNANITSYEIDDELVPILQKSFKNELLDGRFRLINADATEIWQNGGLANQPYDLVANLPYYVATRMILMGLADSLCKSLLVMVQLEVAIKFSAKAGDSEYSALAVLAELAGGAKLLFEVSPECFNPAPKVTSAVLKISKQSQLVGDVFASVSEYDRFCAMLKACFSAPRKKLAKNLSSITPHAKEILSSLGVSELARPHELNSTLYFQIFREIEVKNERRNK